MIDKAETLGSLNLIRRGDSQANQAHETSGVGGSAARSATGPGAGEDGIACRKLSARDIRHLVSNYRLVHVDQPDSLIERSGPLTVALHGLRPFSRMNPITNLAFSGEDRFLAFSQFRQHGTDRRWTLSAMGLANGLFAPERVIQELLEFSVKRAGGKGVKRLFARVQSDSPIRAALDRVGFEAYMHEDLYLLEGVPIATPVDGRVREQDESDTWAVHQLYHASVPKQVQAAEAWTSHKWDVARTKPGKGWWRSFVLDAEHQIIAHACVRTGAKTAVIEFMYAPDYRHELEGFCGGVVAESIRAGGANRVFVTVRAHQSELMTILERIGFASVRRQDLVIKYTAAKVTAKAADAVILAPAEVRERVPKRVPTFLSRRIRERHSA